MEERKFTGIWIPREVWLDKNLSAIDKVVLAEINSLDNDNHCTAGNEYFAEFCQVTEKTISRSIKKLIDCGYVTKVSFDGRVRTLKSNCLFRVDKKSKQNGQNVQADRTNCPTINIYNNKSNNIGSKKHTSAFNDDEYLEEYDSRVATKDSMDYTKTY